MVQAAGAAAGAKTGGDTSRTLAWLVIRWAAEYDPEVRKEMDGTKSAEARYYALAPEIDVVEIVRRAAAGAGDDNGPAATSALAFLQHLLDNNRIIQKPHVTLIHEKEIQDEREAALATNSTLNDEDLATLPKATTWSHCLAISLDSSRPLFAFKMAHLVWTDRIMALSIEDVQPDSFFSPLRSLNSLTNALASNGGTS